jgi:prophage DNA circulation protein
MANPKAIQVSGPGVADVLSQLQGPSWRGVPFPMVRLHNAGGNDLVEHRRPDQDGFPVEATGSNNLVFSTIIPFRNGVLPAPSELWNGRVLYPDVFRAFLGACADKSTGVLIHPELGPQNVKCRHYEWEYVPERRDGCDFTVEWIQSLNDGDFIGSISEPSPIAAATALATQLDADLGALTPPPPELANQTVSFSDMMRSLQAIPDTVTLLSMEIGGAIHRIAAKIDAVEDAVVRLNNVRYWPIVDGLEHLRASIFDLEKKLGTDKKVIRQYVVQKKSSLAIVARLVNNSIEDVMRLNRELLDEPTIPAGTPVRYYKAA